MNILALETSASVAGAAVLVDGKIVSEQYLDHGLTHSEVMLPLAERALSDAKLEVGEIDVFAVDTGPGSFTGVRIGVCAINAMAAALGKKVVGVDALTILAANATVFDGIVSPIIDARSDRVYAAAFTCNGTIPALIGELQACTIQEWVEMLKTMTDQSILFIGDGVPVNHELLKNAFGERACFALPHQNFSRASSCAMIANACAEQGKTVLEVMPVYLRASQAERMGSNG